MNDNQVNSITADEIREVWEGRIRPIASELIPSAIPPATQRFLTEVGLPIVEVLNVCFVEDGRLSEPVRQGDSEFLVLTADNSHIPFAIGLVSEQAFSFSASAPEYTRFFFNSDVATLLNFLGLLSNTVPSPDELDARGELNAEIVAEGTKAIQTSLAARDIAAMKGQSQWRLLLDDLEPQYE